MNLRNMQGLCDENYVIGRYERRLKKMSYSVIPWLGDFVLKRKL